MGFVEGSQRGEIIRDYPGREASGGVRRAEGDGTAEAVAGALLPGAEEAQQPQGRQPGASAGGASSTWT